MYPTKQSLAGAGISPAEQSTRQRDTLKKELNVFDAVAIIVGTVIGSGIFLIPQAVGSQLNSLGMVLLVWIAGGILTISGALSLGEVGALLPGTGGLCKYLNAVYGPLPAFLYAWALILIIHSGSIAALAVAFGLYLGRAAALSVLQQRVINVVVVGVLTAINCLGIRDGKLVQNTVAVAKVGGLAAIILLLGIGGSKPIRFVTGPDAAGLPVFSFARFSIALIAVLWAYEGWHVVSFVAGEIKHPTRNLPLALFYGTSVILIIFVLANLGYYHVLSPLQIARSHAVAADAIERVAGPMGALLVSCLILISILGSLNGLILTGPRVYFAMARDGLFPAGFGGVSGRFHTPTMALIVQGIWASLLAAAGTYEQLFTDVIFTAWIFYGLAVGAVFLLRRRHPQVARPYSVPGYPWVPLIFCIAAALLIASTVIERPIGAAIGVAFIFSGVPVYFLITRLPRKRERPIA